MKKILNLIFIFILLCSFATAFSSGIDNTEYQPLGNPVVDIITTTNPERGDPYTVTWFNSSNTLETDVGFLSILLLGTVFETYTIPINSNWINAGVNVTVNGVTETHYFNVSGSSTSELEINDGRFSPKALMGSIFATDVRVRETVNFTRLDNAQCVVFGTDINEAPLQVCGDVRSYNGRAVCEGLLDNEVFIEGEQYLAKVRCSCGWENNACISDIGSKVEGKHGEVIFVFEVSKWFDVNTVTDKSSYNLNDKEIVVSANVTNYQENRRPMRITASFRCGGSNDALDRILVNDKTVLREISANKTNNTAGFTQMQGIDLKIRNIPSIQNKINYCYASTVVEVLSLDKTTVLHSYSTTSPEFILESNSSFFSEEDNNMSIAFVLTFAIIFIGFILLGFLNEDLKPKFFCFSMAFIQVLILYGVMYGTYIGKDVSGLLSLNLFVILTLGFGIGMISMIIYTIKNLNWELNGKESNKKWSKK